MGTMIILLKKRLRFSIMLTTSHDDQDPQVICTGSQFVPVLPHLLSYCRNSADEKPRLERISVCGRVKSSCDHRTTVMSTNNLQDYF